MRNACPWYERLHAAGGIERAAEGHWWVVSSADLVETLLSDPRLKNADTFEGDLAAVDGADHRRRRLSVSKWFTHSAVDRMEPMIRRIVETLVEEVAESGSFDAISELAQPIARTVICDLVGIPDDVRDRATNKEPQHPLDYKRTVEQVAIDLLRSPKPGTLIADLAKAVKDEALSIEEAANNVYAVIVGGNKPTEALLVNALAELFRRPSIVDSLREDRDGVLRFVDEVLRYESPAWNAGRLVRDPIEVRGKKLEADDTLVLLISAANRDGQRFPKPNQFRRSRHGRHLAFGRGPHACPGAWLALREATILIDVLLDWEVAIEGKPGPFFVSGIRRPESLRMTVSRS